MAAGCHHGCTHTVEHGDRSPFSSMRCIAGRVSSKHLPGDGKQLWGSRLVPCTHVAMGLWAGCWCRSGLQQQGGAGERGGEDSGDWCLQIPVGRKPSETCRGPWWLLWPMVSSLLKVTGSSAGQGSGNQSRSTCLADTGSPYPSSLFLVVSIYFSFAGFWVG